MMARTQRRQLVAYVAPQLGEKFDEVVKAGQDREMRISLSSLCEEALAVGLEYVKQRYVGGSKPIRKARRGKLTSV